MSCSNLNLDLDPMMHASEGVKSTCEAKLPQTSDSCSERNFTTATSRDTLRTGHGNSKPAVWSVPEPEDETLKQLVRHSMINIDTPKMISVWIEVEVSLFPKTVFI